MENSRRGPQEFADIVPGRTTEVYLDVTERRTQSDQADGRQPALVMLQGDLPGQVFRIAAGRQVIGRRNDCQIRLREKAISGHHAEVVRTDAGVSVSDLQSTNGTVVNGRRIRTPVFLAQGNLLKLGNSVFRYVDSLTDVELTESLHVRASSDALTGLWNRPHFVGRAAFVIDTANASRPVSMIAVVLDDFNSVVDSRGRAAADEVLSAVARSLRDQFDDLGRYFARIADESFAIVSGALPLASAAALARSIRSALEPHGVTASVGVAATERPSESAESLLARAEEAAARARREGGNRISLS